MRPRVVVLRGWSVAPWDLRPLELLADAYDVSVLVPAGNLYRLDGLAVERIAVRTLSDALPGGPVGRLLVRAGGERYLHLAERLRGAAIVHVAELGNWYSAHAAALKRRHGYRLAVTTWETLPLCDAYRNVRTRRYARRVLAAADAFLPATERARQALELEGASAARIHVCAPGIDVERFSTARVARPGSDGSHLVLSAGRLVWEKGHQDVLRALALLRAGGRRDLRALIIGDGPERARLIALAADLDLASCVEFRAAVPYDEMPSVYARASCLVLASLPVRFWEEQFGMVLAEALAAHLPIVASSSGAIPEVLGEDGILVGPGDWVGLASALAAGPLAAAPGTRKAPSPDRLAAFSTNAAATRLRAVYGALLGEPPGRAAA